MIHDVRGAGMPNALRMRFAFGIGGTPVAMRSDAALDARLAQLKTQMKHGDLACYSAQALLDDPVFSRLDLGTPLHEVDDDGFSTVCTPPQFAIDDAPERLMR